MTTPFQTLFSGRLWSVMSWEQLDVFWQRIDPSAGWYLYAVGEPPPTEPATAAAVRVGFMEGSGLDVGRGSTRSIMAPIR